MTTIGVDIGGTKIAAGVVTGDGRIVQRARRDTPAQDPNAIAAAIGDLIAELTTERSDVEAVGVACAGYVDKAGSAVIFAPNLAWRDEPLKERIARRTSLPLRLDNDANAAAFGEYLHGGGSRARDVVMITVGTGVGGGIISDGALLRGAFGMAGEIGHLRVVPGGRPCGCGNRGCLEAYASGTALVRDAQDLVRSQKPAADRLTRLCHGIPEELTGADVTAAALEGDAAARGLLAEVGRWLGEAAASLAAVLDPELFVIGGGVADAGDLLMGPVEEAFARELNCRGYRPSAGFATATLGNDAGVVGAAALAREVGDR